MAAFPQRLIAVPTSVALSGNVRPFRAPRAILSTDQATLVLCKSQVVTTLLLSRFALPLGGDRQVPLSFIVGLIHFALIAVLTGGTFSARRLFATALVVAAVLLDTLLIHSHFSVLSVAYVFAIYTPLVLTTSLDPVAALPRLWKSFITLATWLGVLAMAQVALQLVHPGFFFDPIASVPERFLLADYNTTYPVLTGVVDLLKPNAMFMLEPSIASQVIGLGLLGELAFSRRSGRVVLLTAALISTFSGTGILIVLGSILFISSRKTIAVFVLVAGLAAAFISFTNYGQAFGTRLTELSEPGTSGHERFVAPFTAVVDPGTTSARLVLFGHGAGQVTNIDNGLDANYSAIPKVALEYGLVGLVAFILMWYTMFQGLALRGSILAGLLLYYFMASGALLQPFTVFSLWGLSLGFAVKRNVRQTTLTSLGP